MDNTEDIELHELETIERNLNGEAPSEHEATEGYAILSPSGFMILSPSGFMIL
jgi:hypothetical protein